MKSSKKRLMSLVLSAAMVTTTLAGDMSLVAKADELDEAPVSNATLIASFNFDSETDGFAGAGAVATVGEGTVTVSDNAVSGKSAYFDGNTFLSVTKDSGESLLAGLDSATISYVRKYEGGVGWTFYAAPTDETLTWGTHGNKENYIGFIDSGSSVTVERFLNGRGNGSISAGSTSDWELVTVVLDTDKTRIYVNGELASLSGDGTNEYSMSQTVGEDGILQVGKANWLTNGRHEYFQGYIDDLRIFAGALSEEEIMAQYLEFFTPEEEEPEEPEAPVEDVDAVAADKEALAIVNADDVRGNITFPTEGAKGSTITWTSSNAEVVSDQAVENNGYPSTPAGVVTRGAADTEVTLTATITKGEVTETKEFTVNVKAAKQIAETTDYLFAYFTGNTIDGENIYFASSRDGLKYEELNSSNFVLTSELGEKGLRDPYIMRSHEGDKFYMIATDLSIGRNGDWTRAQKSGSQAIMVWESDDLVHWSEQRMAVITDTIKAGCTWAPEAYYDDITGEYVVFWASKVAPNYNLQRIYYTKTRDFVNFTKPEVWIDRKTASTIDTTVIAGNDGYLYRISKNEGNATLPDGQSVTGSTVYMERATSLFGEWTKVSSTTLESIGGVEGPTSYKLNADDAAVDTWVVLLDHFGSNGYAPITTTDLAAGKFKTPEASSYKLPSAPRHGTVLNITADEYAAIQEAFGAKFDEDGDPIVELPSEVKAVCSDKLLYFFDAGVSEDNAKRPRSGIYKAVKKITNIKNDLPDQFYEAGADWGYVNDENYRTSGNRTDEKDDLYSNGWWAKGGYDCEYVVKLAEGDYTATGFFAEYWSQTRAMKFYAEYKNDEGQLVKSEVKSFTLKPGNLRQTAAVSFKVEGVSDKTEVHFKAVKGASSDPVIAGLAIEGTVLNPIPDASEVKAKFKITPSKATKFNDTDKDGFGEFEGWGTSLCWWANRLGYSEKMTRLAATYFFSPEGLDLNIGRYNIGGGDHVGEVVQKTDKSNAKADVYDLETEGKTPTYAGSKMNISNINFSGVTYKFDEPDFGFEKGKNSQSFKMIGYVNNIGGAVGSGDNLHYTVKAKEAGKYTVKILATLAGDNGRNIAIQVNGDKVYTCSNADLKANEIATNGNQHLYVATIKDVELKAGDNAVNVGGNGDWTIDFIKMLVIKAGDEKTSIDSVVEEENADKFLHAPHITRSDSVVPGYCVDVTKIDLSKHDISYYEENFTRADATCGYAWNYDWDADWRQVNILEAANAASGEFIAEAFSNSPPYFMTESGCSSGNFDANKDNLRADSVHAFACYMADVIEHINNKDNGITFQSTTAMNEPYTNYWGANSNKQEGCHFDIGLSESRIIEALNDELEKKGIDIIISGTDETNIDTQITAYKALSDKAKQVVTRIDTHTYSGSKRAELSQLAYENGENLWMSEVDGTFTGGTNAGEMSAAIGIANRVMTDVKELDSTAWILWNAVDMNVDANNQFDKNSLEELGFNGNGGYWGVAIGDHNNQEIVLTKKYYGFGQITRYIRPGMAIIGSTGNSIAAYDPKNEKVVVVAINGAATDKLAKFMLSEFDSIGTSVQAIRTSGDVEDGENWADVSDKVRAAVSSKDKAFYANLKGNSITTFILDAKYTGVVNDPNAPAEPDATEVLSSYNEVEISPSMVTGSAPWNNGADVVTKAFDGNLNTFFDGVLEGYAIVDLGTKQDIKAIAFAPRKGFAGRMLGGLFYGSNDGNKWEVFYEVLDTPAEGKLTPVLAEDFLVKNTSYRYIKYTAAPGENSNVAEIKLYVGQPQEAEKVTYSSFTGTNGARMLDTNGNLIQAHGGQIQQLTIDGVTKYYWIGEDKTNDYRPCPGIHMYSSTDLYNWDDEGVVLKTMESEEDFDNEYFSALYGSRAEDGSISDYQKSVFIDLWQGDSSKGCVIERPKMLYNDKTGKYVVYFHADGNSPYDTDSSSNYGKAKLGVAVSDSVTGPYKLLGTYLLHQNTGYDYGWDHENGHVRDMNVFKDDDGTAYVMYSSDGNANMYIAKLNDEYTGLAMSGTDENGNPVGVKGEDYTVVFVGASREAPAMFKRGNKYYMVSSGCTGWAPNPGKYATADSVLGNWTLYGNPFVSAGSGTSYDTQPTCVVKVGEGKYMYMGDRWANPDDGLKLRNSRYVWLPIEFTSDGGIKIEGRADWDLSVFDSLKAFEIVTELPKTATSVAELYASLPSQLEIRYDGETETKSVDVVWNAQTASDYALDSIKVTGKFDGNKDIAFNVNVVNDKLIYFFDCGAEEAGAGDYYELVKETLGKQLKNVNADQAYTEENGAGYLGNIVADNDGTGVMGVKNAGTDIWSHGFWACTGKNIEYKLNLTKGEYVLALGFAEWWNTTRYNKITVSVDGTEIAAKEFTLDKAATADQQFVEFNLDSDAVVTVSVAKTKGNDPVLSWMGLIQKDLVAHECAPFETRIENVVDYTCTEDGSYDEVVYCECGEELSRETKVVKAHHGTTEVVKEEGKAATCTEAGYFYEVTKCTVCGEELSREEVAIKATGHVKGEFELTKQASVKADGQYAAKCTVCGEVVETKAIKRIGSIVLNEYHFVCDGKAHKPTFTVNDVYGKILVEGKDYDVKYSGNGINKGTYTATVTFKGEYTGTDTKVYYVESPAVKAVMNVVVPVYEKVTSAIRSIFGKIFG